MMAILATTTATSISRDIMLIEILGFGLRQLKGAWTSMLRTTSMWPDIGLPDER
jgi:hypothetical protein